MASHSQLITKGHFSSYIYTFLMIYNTLICLFCSHNSCTHWGFLFVCLFGCPAYSKLIISLWWPQALIKVISSPALEISVLWPVHCGWPSMYSAVKTNSLYTGGESGKIQHGILSKCKHPEVGLSKLHIFVWEIYNGCIWEYGWYHYII